MSVYYQAIGWNQRKKLYDLAIVGVSGLYLITFVLVNLLVFPEITQETLIIRMFGTLAFLQLHIILIIGPLCRLNPVFLPLLYNRRHLGVSMFIMAAIHGIFSVVQFHALSNINPVLSVFISNTHYESLTRFPFQVFGLIALVILFLMAATSHDFWLNFLGARIWKSLHMLVYAAYALIILHVFFGIIQYETSPVLVTILLIGFAFVCVLHIVSSAREHKKDNEKVRESKQGFVKVCSVNEIKEKRARIVCLEGERIAIFKYDNKVSAISNVCKHQNGPLGEGRIIDGCITCPWHGYQYLPHNGSSPPPFEEKVPTYDVKIISGNVWLNPKPYAAGTERTPATINY